MKTKLFLLLLISFVVTGAKSQNNQDVVDYYNLKIDELVGKWQTLSLDDEEEKTNPVYAKVFTTPVLYNSVIEKAFTTEENAVEKECKSPVHVSSKIKTSMEQTILGVGL